jgi:hypothetical protein
MPVEVTDAPRYQLHALVLPGELRVRMSDMAQGDIAVIDEDSPTPFSLSTELPGRTTPLSG